MRRRRKRRGTWFPVNGHSINSEGVGTYYYADLPVNVPDVNQYGAQGPTRFIAPVLPDFTEQQGTGAIVNNPQLQDIVSGQTWVLDRIVGKLHLQVSTAGDADADDTWPYVFVVAGFFVGRAEDDAPAQVALDADETDPQGKDNSMNPWIWRRSWILANPVNSITFARSSWPISNAHYGSVLDGPHIDSRVNRYVPREHRLWFTATARGFNETGEIIDTGAAQPGVYGTLDYRIYGRLAKSKNLSTF